MFRKRFGPVLMGGFGYFSFGVKSEAPPRTRILGPSATPKSLFSNSEAQSGGTTANQELLNLLGVSGTFPDTPRKNWGWWFGSF